MLMVKDPMVIGNAYFCVDICKIKLKSILDLSGNLKQNVYTVTATVWIYPWIYYLIYY